MILQKQVDGKPMLVGYWSRTLSLAERNPQRQKESAWTSSGKSFYYEHAWTVCDLQSERTTPTLDGF